MSKIKGKLRFIRLHQWWGIWISMFLWFVKIKHYMNHWDILIYTSYVYGTLKNCAKLLPKFFSEKSEVKHEAEEGRRKGVRITDFSQLRSSSWRKHCQKHNDSEDSLSESDLSRLLTENLRSFSALWMQSSALCFLLSRLWLLWKESGIDLCAYRHNFGNSIAKEP